MKQFLITLFVLCSFRGYSQLLLPDTVVVKAVHDGDSYKVQYPNGEVEWVRLWGVDCPEVISNHIKKNQPYGVQAGNFVRSWLKGERVVMHSEVETDDPFGRRIVRIQVDSALYSKLDSVPGEFMNDLSAYLVENGYAWYINASLKENQERAKQTKIGLWALPGRKLRPETWRKRNWN